MEGCPSLGSAVDKWYARCRESYKENKYVFDNHFRPQLEFLLPTTKVFMLENGLQYLVDYISSSLDIDFDMSAIKNQKEGAHLRRAGGDPELTRRLLDCVPSEKTRILIMKDYRKDFEFIDGFKSSSMIEV